jgi:hypothetical protein
MGWVVRLTAPWQREPGGMWWEVTMYASMIPWIRSNNTWVIPGSLSFVAVNLRRDLLLSSCHLLGLSFSRTVATRQPVHHQHELTLMGKPKHQRSYKTTAAKRSQSTRSRL